MREENTNHSPRRDEQSHHAFFHDQRGRTAWEVFLLISCCLLASITATQLHTLHTLSSPAPHSVFIAAIGVGGTALTLWNIVNAVIAHLGTLRMLPGWLRHLCTAFVERWGTGHARQILLRSGAQLAFGVGTLSVGITPLALAADLPAPEIPPATIPSAEAPMSDSEAIPELSAPPIQSALPSPLLADAFEGHSPKEPPSPHSTPESAASGAATPHASPEVATPPSLVQGDQMATPPAAGNFTSPSPSSRPPEHTNAVAQDAQRRMEKALSDQHSKRTPHSSDSSTSSSVSPQIGASPTMRPSSSEHPEALVGPRTPTPHVSPSPSHAHVVAPEECLWTIAARLLPEDSSDAAIARAWQEIYSLNINAIGPNPDFILPGTTLILPATL